MIHKDSLSWMSFQSVQAYFERLSPLDQLRWRVHVSCDVNPNDAQVFTEEDCEWILKYHRGAA